MGWNRATHRTNQDDRDTNRRGPYGSNIVVAPVTFKGDEEATMLDPRSPLEDKMDHPDPKTRGEKKGQKTKGPYSTKHVRIMQALAEAKAAAKPTKALKK